MCIHLHIHTGVRLENATHEALGRVRDVKPVRKRIAICFDQFVCALDIACLKRGLAHQTSVHDNADAPHVHLKAVPVLALQHL